ncbi:MAG TPA: hypothetical protein VN457_01315, partial [Chlamydiales bacterium]|nr:hypothetical protein [Chlamydiales bacterium]
MTIQTVLGFLGWGAPATKSSSVSAAAKRTEPSHDLSIDSVKQLTKDAKAGKVEPLIDWMNRFEKASVNPLVYQLPEVTPLFSELMLEQCVLEKVPRDLARKVGRVFQREAIFKKNPPKETAVIVCRDGGTVAVNAALFSLFCDSFQK